MVKSGIAQSVEYVDTFKINLQDLGKISKLYRMEAKGVMVAVVIGKAQNTYAEQGIIYCPLYLVNSNEKMIQIGLFEFLQEKAMFYLENDELIETENLEPLFYDGVTAELLQSVRYNPQHLEVEDSEATVSKTMKNKSALFLYEDEHADVFIKTLGVAVPPELREETKEDDKKIRKEYLYNKDDLWITQFMKNGNYDVIDNEGGDDCLFSVVRDAFSSIGLQTTMLKLRKKLADELNEGDYEFFNSQYVMYLENIKVTSEKIKKLEKEYIELKQKFTETKDKQEQKELLGLATAVKKEHDQMVIEKKMSQEVMLKYQFMKDIGSLDELRTKMLKGNYCEDAWVIPKMEKALNLKFVILADTAEDSKIHVLDCPDMKKDDSDRVIAYYILVERQKSGLYRVLSYKTRNIFTYKELPYGIKDLIKESCK